MTKEEKVFLFKVFHEIYHKRTNTSASKDLLIQAEKYYFLYQIAITLLPLNRKLLEEIFEAPNLGQFEKELEELFGDD